MIFILVLTAKPFRTGPVDESLTGLGRSPDW